MVKPLLRHYTSSFAGVNPKLFTVKDLAILFRKDEETIRCWIRDGDVFPGAFKVTGGWYVPGGDVKHLMNRPTADIDGSRADVRTMKERIHGRNRGASH